MNIQKIGFIGLGLIGGSIALKIKELYPEVEMIAIAHGEATIQTAYKMGIIKNQNSIPLEDFGDCDLIFLCAPVENNIQYLKLLKPIIKESCLITDVGSTKIKIHQEVLKLGLEKNFIGGHPMTGSEKNGLEFANPIFLENAYYIITPAEGTTEGQKDFMLNLVKAFLSIPLILDYNKHDIATAAISHLPHMISFSLTNFIHEIDDQNETMKTISAGSFRDMTRVAASSPAMWESITSSNREPIIQLMDRYMAYLDALKENIKNYKSKEIYDYFSKAKDYRDSLNVPGKQIKRLVHEIYVDLKDETGQIGIIATMLAFKGINLKNIGIVNNREYEEGVLRIEFYDEHAKESAIDILKDKNYTIHLR